MKKASIILNNPFEKLNTFTNRLKSPIVLFETNKSKTNTIEVVLNFLIIELK